MCLLCTCALFAGVYFVFVFVFVHLLTTGRTVRAALAPCKAHVRTIRQFHAPHLLLFITWGRALCTFSVARAVSCTFEPSTQCGVLDVPLCPRARALHDSCRALQDAGKKLQTRVYGGWARTHAHMQTRHLSSPRRASSCLMVQDLPVPLPRQPRSRLSLLEAHKGV